MKWLLHKIEALRKVGAKFAAIGTSIPHMVFDAVKSPLSLPRVSIVAAPVTGRRR